MVNPIDRLGKYAIEGGPGRPRGSRNKVTRMAEEFREKVLELAASDDYKLITVLAEKAEAGDTKSASLFIDILRAVLPKHVVEVDGGEWDEGDFEKTVIELQKHGFKPPNPSFRFKDWKKNQN